MGLLSSLFKKPQNQEPATGEKEYHPQGEPLLLSGEEERTVYTYDGAPLRGIKKNERFVLRATAEEVTLISAETDDEWSTRDPDSDACPLLYNGHPIGFVSSYGGLLQELCRRGFDVQIEAKRTGTYSPIIPEIKAYLPSYHEVKKLLAERS